MGYRDGNRGIDRMLSLVRASLRSTAGRHLLPASNGLPPARLSSPSGLRQSGLLSTSDHLPGPRHLSAELLASMATARGQLRQLL